MRLPMLMNGLLRGVLVALGAAAIVGVALAAAFGVFGGGGLGGFFGGGVDGNDGGFGIDGAAAFGGAVAIGVSVVAGFVAVVVPQMVVLSARFAKGGKSPLSLWAVKFSLIFLLMAVAVRGLSALSVFVASGFIFGVVAAVCVNIALTAKMTMQQISQQQASTGEPRGTNPPMARATNPAATAAMPRATRID